MNSFLITCLIVSHLPPHDMVSFETILCYLNQGRELERFARDENAASLVLNRGLKMDHCKGKKFWVGLV